MNGEIENLKLTELAELLLDEDDEVYSSFYSVSSGSGSGLLLLSPIKTSPDLSQIRIVKESSQISHHIELFRNSEILALDIETRGTNPRDPLFFIVGLALSDGNNSVYFDGTSINLSEVITLLSKMKAQFIAHNMPFDSYCIKQTYNGTWLNWKYCTLALFRFLATEGFSGQRWGLKEAQVQLLGWDEKGDKELDEWLINNGYFKTMKGGVRRPKKSEMWRAPTEVLGKYCSLDAQSTFILFDRILSPKLGEFPALKKYYQFFFFPLTKWLIEQQELGIQVDKPKLVNYLNSLRQLREQRRTAFLTCPEIFSQIQKRNEIVLSKYQVKEPKRFKKDGDVSKNWIKWNERMEVLKSQIHFNLDSGPQRKWLFYDELKHPVIFRTKGTKNNPNGTPAVDRKAASQWGIPGKLLTEYADVTKELSYVEAGVDHADPKDTIRPEFKIPGTLTGRLAGAGGLNVQQVPVTRGYLECWIPRPGMKWISVDHTSVEQVVLAELSRDPSLWKLYGPGAIPQDVYLFNGAQLPIIGERIRSVGYDPESPTVNAIARAKKECKRERGIAKTVTLASSYGAGAQKIHSTLLVQGISISLDEAREIHSAYWSLYSGVKEYEKELRRQYENNGGWLLNGIGRPLTIAPGYIKDIVNRVVQSTAHDLHVMFVSFVLSIITSHGIKWNPIILDWHDQLIVEVPADQAEKVKELIEVNAYRQLNNCIQPIIPLRGEAIIVDNLAEAKCDE